jgi:hypothetical protein
MSAIRYVPTHDARAAVKGRETDLLDALGINWRVGRPHIRCPYPDHGGGGDWRWDAKAAKARCTCTKGDDVFDVLMRVEGIDFDAAKIRAAELIGRSDLIRNGDGQRYQATDAASLLRAPADRRDNTLPLAYLAHRLGVAADAVPTPSTPMVGLKSLGYYDPPPFGSQTKPKLVGEFPCAVFGTVAADGRTHAHRIYLAPGGAGKADLGAGSDGHPRDPKKSAKILDGDNTSGRSVLWGDPERAPHVIIAEGIETGAAVALALAAEIQSGEAAVASAITAGGVEAFQPYPATRRITIAADRDEASKNGKHGSRRGEEAAREFGRRHHETLEIAVALPGAPGESVDWLDVLRREGADAVRAGILAASPFAQGTAGGYRGNGAAETAHKSGGAEVPPSPPQQNYPPPLAEEAFHGVAGELVRTIEPHTEADPAAILIQFLVCAGSAVGRGPHFRIEAGRHQTNLFAVLVGETSQGRKGTSLGWAKRATIAADPSWENCITSGLASGEGLIHAVRDTRYGVDKKGEQIVVDEGVVDKRLLVIEEEFARVLRVGSREGNILSSVVRDAWDGKPLRGLSKNSPSKASGAHISIIGHITREELIANLAEGDATNGVGNRFLWACVRRSKLLPFGGDAPGLDAITGPLHGILDAARTEHSMCFDAATRRAWAEVYPALTKERGGMLGAMLARAPAQVIRLALVYAILDRSRAICLPHLKAALAVWEYCEASARWIFGGALEDPVADRIVGALRCNEGPLSQTELHSLFCRHVSGTRLLEALADLQRRGLVRAERLPSTGGRPKTLWQYDARQTRRPREKSLHCRNGLFLLANAAQGGLSALISQFRRERAKGAPSLVDVMLKNKNIIISMT